MLISSWKGNLSLILTILTSPEACASNHLPILINVTLHQKHCGCAKEVFFPAPHRMNAKAAKASVKLYDAQFPIIEEKLRVYKSQVAFDVDATKLQAMIRKPWMVKVKSKPQRHTASWSVTAYRFATWRFNFVRLVLSAEGKTEY